MVKKKKPEKKVEQPAKGKETQSKKKPAATKENPLGKKHVCYSCGTKFYDLNKETVICPRCGADQNSKPAQKQKTVRISKLTEFDVVDEEVVDSPEEDLEYEPEVGLDEEPILDEEEV
jgi:uncharacterized protein (TIGR02300 family)